MGRYFLAVLALCASSVLSIIALQPDPLVRFEADLSRMAPENALDKLNKPGSYDIEQHNVALFHTDLLIASGDFLAAETLLTKLNETLPQNEEVGRRQAKIASLLGKSDAKIQFAKAEHEKHPTPDSRSALSRIYRVQRNQDAEIDVLRSVAPEQLSQWEAARLARLLLANGEYDEAESLFLQLAAGDGELADQAKIRLIVMHIDEGRSHEVLNRLMEWYVASEFSPKVVEALLPVFLARGAINEAIWIAEKVVEFSPASAHRLLRLFSNSGHRAIARHLQDEILSRRSTLTQDEWAAITKFAALTGDVRGLQTAIVKANAHDMPPALLADALLQLLRYQGPRALIPYRKFATPDLADQAPLIAAAFAIEQAQPEAAVRHLAMAAETDLGDWDQSIWLSIALKLANTGYDRLLLNSPSINQPMKEALASSL